MKTVADFKRKAVVGSKWHCVFHQKHDGRDPETGFMKIIDEDKGIREVSKQCTVHIAFKTTHKDGKVVDSFLQYPKAKDVKFIDEDTMQVYEDGRLLLTYTFVETAVTESNPDFIAGDDAKNYIQVGINKMQLNGDTYSWSSDAKGWLKDAPTT